jgi:hypothetical protein
MPEFASLAPQVSAFGFSHFSYADAASLYETVSVCRDETRGI